MLSVILIIFFSCILVLNLIKIREGVSNSDSSKINLSRAKDGSERIKQKIKDAKIELNGKIENITKLFQDLVKSKEEKNRKNIQKNLKMMIKANKEIS